MCYFIIFVHNFFFYGYLYTIYFVVKILWYVKKAYCNYRFFVVVNFISITNTSFSKKITNTLFLMQVIIKIYWRIDALLEWLIVAIAENMHALLHSLLAVFAIYFLIWLSIFSLLNREKLYRIQDKQGIQCTTLLKDSHSTWDILREFLHLWNHGELVACAGQKIRCTLVIKCTRFYQTWQACDQFTGLALLWSLCQCRILSRLSSFRFTEIGTKISSTTTC